MSGTGSSATFRNEISYMEPWLVLAALLELGMRKEQGCVSMSCPNVSCLTSDVPGFLCLYAICCTPCPLNSCSRQFLSGLLLALDASQHLHSTSRVHLCPLMRLPHRPLACERRSNGTFLAQRKVQRSGKPPAEAAEGMMNA